MGGGGEGGENMLASRLEAKSGGNSGPKSRVQMAYTRLRHCSSDSFFSSGWIDVDSSASQSVPSTIINLLGI
ncbi:unnamed protein product [Caenorhabditis auriculariae]|uniref:Uncharacterized protein n=1 Tax=Caenorhabditis auriculariae TaxID=2777116 RepID=A0A8S1HE88_9PELO|nr:unnamed protein product [Caenorhabditis auriculariae]